MIRVRWFRRVSNEYGSYSFGQGRVSSEYVGYFFMVFCGFSGFFRESGQEVSNESGYSALVQRE